MTLDLNLLPDGGMSWLDASGPDSNIVLSTRVRLARNLQGMAFTVRAKQADLDAVLDQVTEAGRQMPILRDAALFRLDQMDRVERQLLHERHMVSRELAGLERSRPVRHAAALLTNGDLAVMINEEDHLRLQSLQSGFGLSRAYAEIERLDSELGARVAVAFHPEFGYLTACPTNAGTGLRASVLIHLPGLVLTKEIAKVLQGLSQVGLTFRGLYGEGSEVVGNFFQLSNQTTLGKSEEELLDHLGKMVQQVVDYEEQARAILQREAPAVIADKVWRAYGLLRYARSLSFEETMNLLSGVRLGVGLNLIPQLSVYTLNKLLIFTQPAHLAQREGRALSDPELPIFRASYVRRLLESDAARRGSGGGDAARH
ncbi:MAG: ATP--guanido phosphotransferase [Gemmatimonadales bacterium]|nr:ATP--guanido phosphotransferase [Gemmatimonadales bacterium]